MKRTEETRRIRNTALPFARVPEGDAVNDTHYFAFVF